MVSVMSEELEYKLYHISNLLIDLCEEHNMCTRDYFLIKYNLTSQESDIINNVFKNIIDSGTIINLDGFEKMVNSYLNKKFTREVIQELLTAYKEYFPKIVTLIME
ncbi:hypothetical protein CIRMBP1315_02318 [Enterococcus cecorum]|nr:hypothetical protein CIRMBP1315_02318 [Enterococcus cecorum]